MALGFVPYSTTNNSLNSRWRSSPMKLGGLKSDEFLALSPQGLMPALTIQKEHDSGMTHLSESDTIARYLLAEYADWWHDVYLTTIQGCLYKPASRFPIGDYADRKSAISAFQKQLKTIEGFMSDDGMYLCGDDISKIYKEIMDTLVTSWEEKNHRWDSIWLAGQRDEAPGTIFDKILFQRIGMGLQSRKASAEHTDILGRLLVAGAEIANDTELGFGDGARFVINDGDDGGQEVYHVHLHVLGGRKLGPMG
ncbi:hypothetical protein QTG54_002937 [Skeletonema marinoi]|uniref:GST N-terminal domain-containing protein n=1 Tax=Skeletonema marinoi TaxID=267567 RepID=A0AAD8YJP3_9STRA|nr:hypothetical protein QTG54_002937 [Skeletonema marinoi]